MADNYVLRITAGPGYDTSDHVEVPVNTPAPLSINSSRASIDLSVRVQNYNGLPRNSPTTSPYFDTEPHAYNQDQYSICFRFTPKDQDIKATDLQFGNDFDRPIRDRLPPGFNTAMGIVRWWIDPGLDGDAYADRPYLYGPALSSINALSIGPGEFNEKKGGIFVEEGGDGAQRKETGMPDDAKARMKWALNDTNKEKFLFRKGQTYTMDFFNPYLDFSSFSLRLPGFHLPVLKYWDGQGIRTTPRRSHTLRYVLRNKTTGDVYLAVCFTIHRKEDVDEEGNVREDAEVKGLGEAVHDGNVEEGFDDEKALKEAREKLGPRHGEETSADDVD